MSSYENLHKMREKIEQTTNGLYYLLKIANEDIPELKELVTELNELNEKLVQENEVLLEAVKYYATNDKWVLRNINNKAKETLEKLGKHDILET